MFAKSHPPLFARYDALVAAQAIERDDAQLAAVRALDRLLHEMERPARLGTWLPFFKRRAAPTAPRGVYLWGHVGRGKTTLMDLFFESAAAPRKRRVHFHAFMAEVHARLHAARRNANGGADPVARVAGELAQEARLLCFDEFAVFDIADATILARLFSALFSAGVVVVATSNVEPQRLYEGGRNRDLFLPFIALLAERMQVVQLDARADFRLEKACAGEVFFLAADDRARTRAQENLAMKFGGAPFAPAALEVNGRMFEIPKALGASAYGAAARFDFSEICGRPLGAADYLALAKAYDIVIVDNVPQMGFERRNEAKRFITLVDILYEAKTKLILCAEVEAAEIYKADHGVEAQEFRRTASRLFEMRSKDYLDAWAARSSSSR